ncbi:hypothetical protein RJ640_012283, partial [Escallonia rubra]
MPLVAKSHTTITLLSQTNTNTATTLPNPNQSSPSITNTNQILELLLYSPIRPIVDYAVLLLWLMAVGTIVCASVWSASTASEQSDERYNELSPKVPVNYLFLFAFVFSHQEKVKSTWGEEHDEKTKRKRDIESCNVGSVKEDVEKEFLDINARSAVVFVITASTFLVLLYLFMSSWFVWLLIVLFCIGGIEESTEFQAEWTSEILYPANVTLLSSNFHRELAVILLGIVGVIIETDRGMHTCIVSAISSKCRSCGQKTVNLPLLGEVSILSLVVLLCCLAFAIFWAAKRKASYSWVGQDIL